MLITRMSSRRPMARLALLIMLMIVHGTTPKNSSIEVQHWIALVDVLVPAIHRP